MKRHGHLWKRMISFYHLLRSAEKARQGKRYRPAVASFDFDLEPQLWTLHHELATKTYQPGPYHTFEIYEPKQRLISAVPYRDRIVHHALTSVLEPIFERSFVFDSYACRKRKGRHAAVDRAQQFARRFRYVLKADIRKFFPSLDHQILKDLALLRRENHGIEPGLAEWFDAYIVQLAGLMRLDAAIPYIIERSHLAEDDIADACGDALGRIGTDAVVEAIASDWECGDFNFRSIMCSALEKIHTDLCARVSLEFLCEEQNGEVQLEVGHALLAHFEFDGIELVQQLVEGDDEDLHPEGRDLRSRLVAAATIMGATFPEYEEWHDEAVRTNYGWFEYERKRIAENFGS